MTARTAAGQSLLDHIDRYRSELRATADAKRPADSTLATAYGTLANGMDLARGIVCEHLLAVELASVRDLGECHDCGSTDAEAHEAGCSFADDQEPPFDAEPVTFAEWLERAEHYAREAGVWR